MVMDGGYWRLFTSVRTGVWGVPCPLLRTGPLILTGPVDTDGPPKYVIKARKKRGPKPTQRSGVGRPLFARALVYHPSETVDLVAFFVISLFFECFSDDFV